MSKYENLYLKVKNDKTELFNILNDFSNFGIIKSEDINKLSDIRDKYPNFHQSILKTFEEWNKLGYRIKAGSKGTKLYKNKEGLNSYFDIKQVYTNKEIEKPITRTYLKDALILMENSKNTDFYENYIKGIRNKVDNSLNENERILIENLVINVIFDKYDYYSESKITNKKDDKKMILESIEFLKSEIYENPEIFDKIIDETAKLSNEIISKIFYKAKEIYNKVNNNQKPFINVCCNYKILENIASKFDEAIQKEYDILIHNIKDKYKDPKNFIKIQNLLTKEKGFEESIKNLKEKYKQLNVEVPTINNKNILK